MESKFKLNSFNVSSTENISVHSEKVGFKEYKFEISSEDLESWNNEVENIHEILMSAHLLNLSELLKNKKLIERSQKILDTIDTATPELKRHISELLAISIWAIDNQNNWPGNFTSGFRMIKGGTQNLADFIKDTGSTKPSCLDMTAIVEALSQKRNINGEIKRLGTSGKGSRFEHRYWESETGIKIDTFWGRDVAGIYLSDEVYNERRILRKEQRSSGRLIGKFDCASSLADENIDDDIQNVA